VINPFLACCLFTRQVELCGPACDVDLDALGVLVVAEEGPEMFPAIEAADFAVGVGTTQVTEVAVPRWGRFVSEIC
jgi:hypothetical protein